MKTQLLLGVFGLVAMMVGCAAPSVGEEGKKSSSSKMKTDGWPESTNVEDRRNDPPGTEYPNQPATPNEPVDTSPGSLADQAGINDIGKNNNGAGGDSSQTSADQNNEQANGSDGDNDGAQGVDHGGDSDGADADDGSGDGDGEEGVDDGGDSDGAEADDGSGDGDGDGAEADDGSGD